MNDVKIRIIDFIKKSEMRRTMIVYVIVISYAFLASISIGAIFYGLHYKLKVNGLQKIITQKDNTIFEKTNKIRVLFENIEELYQYKNRVLDLEDDVKRIDSMNMRIDVKRVDCPLTDSELRVFSKLITNEFSNGGKRNDMEALMKVQDKIYEIVENHATFINHEKSLEKIKKDDKAGFPKKKNVIGGSN